MTLSAPLSETEVRGLVTIKWSSEAYCIVASRSTCYYSENQKFCFLKSRLLTCPHIFFRNKSFLLKIESWNIQHFIDLQFREFSQNFSSFEQLLFFGAHVTNWIQIQLVRWGVTNQYVLLLMTIQNLIVLMSQPTSTLWSMPHQWHLPNKQWPKTFKKWHLKQGKSF